MKTSFNIGLVEVESCIVLKKNKIWQHFLAIIMCFHPSTIVNMRTKNTKGHTSLQWDGPILPMFYQKFCLHYGPHHKVLMKNRGVWVDYKMSISVGGHKTMVFGWTDFSCTKMAHGVSCPHICIEFGSRGYVSSKSYQKMWSANYIHL
jgi:hypothetical protein